MDATAPDKTEGTAVVTRGDLLDALQSSSLLVELSLSTWTGEITDKKLARKVKEDTGATGRLGRFILNLFSGCDEELRDLCNAYTHVRHRHNALTLPYITTANKGNTRNRANDGTRLLSTAIFTQYLDEITGLKKLAQDKRDVFLGHYNDLVTQAKTNLGTAFDQSHYPSRDQVRASFRISYDFKPIPQANALPELPDDALRALSANLDRRNLRVLEAAQKSLWDRVRETVGKVAERMEEGKEFKVNTFVNATALAELMPGLNPMNDPHVPEIVRDIELMLRGVDAEQVRKDESYRAEIHNQARAIIKKLDQWAV